MNGLFYYTERMFLYDYSVLDLNFGQIGKSEKAAEAQAAAAGDAEHQGDEMNATAVHNVMT